MSTEVKIATTKEERKISSRLVYANYLKKNFCKPNEIEQFWDINKRYPNWTTFNYYEENFLKGTLTVIVDGNVGLPSEALYQDEINKIRKKGGQLCELSKLSLESEKRTLKPIMQLITYCYLYNQVTRLADHCVILVEPKHQKFYTKKLGFKVIGDIKIDKEAGNAESVLLYCHLNKGKLKEIILKQPQEHLNRIRDQIGLHIDKNTTRSFPFKFISDILNLFKRSKENKGSEGLSTS